MPATAERINVLVTDFIAGLPLRDYQRDAVLQLSKLADDVSRVHVAEMPTGAGKTWVGCALMAWLIAQGRKVTWISKSWELLRQTADRLVQLCPQHARQLSRMGGDDSVLRHIPDRTDGRAVFTTLQTWAAWQAGPQRGVVIWDEVHWAINSPMGSRFLDAQLGASVVYGLTATPVLNARSRVVYSVPIEGLLGTVLAQPVIREIDTDTAWSPEVRYEEFTPGSLRGLASDGMRNQLIVKEVLAGRSRGDFKRTLVFACDIAHADSLASMLCRHGVPAGVVHSRLSEAAQEDRVRRFRDGRLVVMVNVSMLTEGVDVPEIDSVLLARPTRSVNLLKQMIGRGARKAEGKETFSVVDFRDNVGLLKDRPVSASDVLNLKHLPAPRVRRSRPVTRHEESLDTPRFEEVDFPGVGRLPIALGQTFGVEMELTCEGAVPKMGSKKWSQTARAIIQRLHEVTAHVWPEPLRYHQPADLTTWRVMHDSSCGWEVVSPILLDVEGVDDLRKVCDGLTNFVIERPFLRVNSRTGMHLTLGTKLNTDERLRGFIKRVQRLEPGLFTLTSPSRLFEYDEAGNYSTREGNEYCWPLRLGDDADRLHLGDLDRYDTVNLTRSHSDVQTLEVRMHGGTTEFRKVSAWLSLWMQIFNRSRYAWRGDGVTGAVFPNGNVRLDATQSDREDVVKLLAAEEIELSKGFIALLRRRRRELSVNWGRVLPMRVAAWEAAGWYVDCD